MTAPEQRKRSAYDGIDAAPALALAESADFGFHLPGVDATSATVRIDPEADGIMLVIETEGETAEASIGAQLDPAAADALATTLRHASERERQAGHQ